MTAPDRMAAITVRARTVSEINRHEHWRKRQKRVLAQRMTTALALKRAGWPLIPAPCEITLTRLSSGTLDDDNLGSALKGIRDAIAKCYGLDDKPGTGLTWRPQQEKCRRGEEGVRIVARPAPIVPYSEVSAWLEANRASVRWRDDGICVVTRSLGFAGSVLPLGVEGRTLEEAVRRAMGVS